MTRWHITLDIPDDQENGDPWSLLGYLTDVYAYPEDIGPDDEGGITVTIAQDVPTGLVLDGVLLTPPTFRTVEIPPKDTP